MIDESIRLNEKYLDLYGEKINVKNIVYSEVVSFLGSGGITSVNNPNMDDILILFIKNKKGKIKKRFIRYDETTDIFRLSNLIRTLIGLPKQCDIKKYGSYKGYLKWKKETARKIKDYCGEHKTSKNLKIEGGDV